MDADLLQLTLAALAFAIALNIKLTLAARRSTLRALAPPATLQPGHTLPAMRATVLAGGGRVALGAAGTACALLFLSSQCPKCRAKVPHLASLVELADAAGLAMWIVSEEPRWRLASLLRGTTLASRTLRLGRADYRLVNPLRASPAYLFVDRHGSIEATGLIGDADWLALERQLTGADGVEHAA